MSALVVLKPYDVEAIAKIDAASAALSNVRDVYDAKRALDGSKLLKQWARAVGCNDEVLRNASALAIETHRIFGVHWRSAEKATGGWASCDIDPIYQDRPPTLEELDIRPNTAAEAVKLADLADTSPDVYERIKSGEITKRAGLATLAPKKEPEPFSIVVACRDLEDLVRSTIGKWPEEHQSAAETPLKKVLKEIAERSGTESRSKRSLLRYPGSKDKVADKILSRHFGALRTGRPIEYREPFFGSGSFGFRALGGLSVDSSIWINDKDSALIALWRSVYSKPDELTKMIGEFTPTTDAFFLFKEQDGNADLDEVTAGFQKLALHQLSFSGIGAKAGGPIGGKNQTGDNDVGCRWNAERHIKHVNQWNRLLRSFSSVKITGVDFAELIDGAPSDSFIYLDPPYYEKGGELYKHSFDDETHRRLANSLRGCDAQWVLSYDDNEFVRDLYSWADISLIDLKYTVAASSSNREVKQELIIKPKAEQQ